MAQIRIIHIDPTREQSLNRDFDLKESPSPRQSYIASTF